MTEKIEYKIGRSIPAPPPAPMDPPGGTLLSSVPPSQKRFTRKYVVGCLLMLPLLIVLGISFMSSIGWDRFLEVVATTFIAAIILVLFVAGLGLLVSEN